MKNIVALSWGRSLSPTNIINTDCIAYGCSQRLSGSLRLESRVDELVFGNGVSTPAREKERGIALRSNIAWHVRTSDKFRRMEMSSRSARSIASPVLVGAFRRRPFTSCPLTRLTRRLSASAGGSKHHSGHSNASHVLFSCSLFFECQ